MTFSFIYCPLIVTFPEAFQKEVTTPFIVHADFFAPVAGVFLIGDSDAESKERGWVTITRTSYSISAYATQ